MDDYILHLSIIALASNMWACSVIALSVKALRQQMDDLKHDIPVCRLVL